MTVWNPHARFKVCGPSLLAVYLVAFILKGGHCAAPLVFPPARGAARPLALFLPLLPGQMELAFLSGLHAAEGLGKGTKKLKNKPVNFSTF